MYIFLKDFEIKGWYEEYIDDGNPGIGTYTRTVNMMFGRNELLGTSSNKNEKMIVIPNSKYGVSMYGSTAFIETSINFLIDQGILKELTDEEAENIMAIQEIVECSGTELGSPSLICPTGLTRKKPQSRTIDVTSNK